MKFVIQRVNNASVEINSEIFSKIDKGYLVLVGISDSDTKEIADKMLQKLIGLRIFEDEKGKTNGHGAYLKKDIEVIDKAQKTKVLAKKLEVNIPDSIYDDLRKMV